MVSRSRSCVLCMLLCITPVVEAFAQEWTRFRGPNGSGISSAVTVPAEWSEDDYNWRVKLPGVGHSSPVLWGERLFVTGGDEQTGTRVALCLDAGSGEQIWAKRFPAATHRKHGLNSFASATPTVDQEHVYVCWATPDEYVVLALDHAGGEVWRRDLGAYQSSYGFGSSPIVYGDLLVVTHEHEGDSSVVALDRKSGEIRWRVPRRSKVTFSTPCVYRHRGGSEELIFVSWTHGITAVDPATGRTNWEVDVFNKEHVETSIGSTVVSDELVFGCSGWLGVRMEVVAVRPQSPAARLPESGLLDTASPAKEAFRIDRAAPLVTTPLVKDDLLLLWSDEGIVSCLDARSGDVHWRQRVGGTYYGSPVCVGNRLYCMSAEGDAVVLAASKEYAPLGRNPLGEGSHSTPAVAGGVMYLRTFSHLISIGGPLEARASASAGRHSFAPPFARSATVFPKRPK